MRRRTRFVPLSLIPGLILGLCFGFGCEFATRPALAAPPSLPATPSKIAAPSRTTTRAATAVDQDGRRHAWSGEQGTLTVIDFAATWCVPCRRTLPKLQRLADEHPELRVLVVSVDDTAAQRDRLVEDLDLRVPVLWDAGHRIAEHYRPEAMPATVVLDAAGREIHRHTGSGDDDWDDFVALVEARLAAEPAG